MIAAYAAVQISGKKSAGRIFVKCFDLFTMRRAAK